MNKSVSHCQSIIRSFRRCCVTCEDPLLHLDDDLPRVDVHAEVDEGEHGHVHEDALDQQRGLVMATKPRWKFQIL